MTIKRIKLERLDPESIYVSTEDGMEYGGDRLMNLGLNFKDSKDFSSKIYVLKRK